MEQGDSGAGDFWAGIHPKAVFAAALLNLDCSGNGIPGHSGRKWLAAEVEEALNSNHGH